MFVGLALSCGSPASALIRGQVKLANDSTPQVYDVLLSGPVRYAVRTNDLGAWTVRVSPGAYSVSVSVPGTLEETIKRSAVVEKDRSQDVETMVFTPSGSIRGKVLSWQGEAAREVSVMVVGGSGSAQTDAKGVFELPRVAVGRRDLMVWTTESEVSRIDGVEVQRGKVAALEPIVLKKRQPLESSSLGRITGRAEVPGLDDLSGIEVRLEGTQWSTQTSPDGSFELAAIPKGQVSIAFRKGEAWARLPKVLVVPDSEAFIIDGGLHPLKEMTVYLSRGHQLLERDGFWRERSPDGKWTSIVSGETLWMVGLSAAYPLGKGNRLRATTFAGNPAKDYWLIWAPEDPAAWRLSRFVLSEHRLETVAALPHGDFFFYPLDSGIVFAGGRQVYVFPTGASAPLRLELEGVLMQAVKVDAETVFVLTEKFVREIRSDGTVVDKLPLDTMEFYLASSSDGRWVTIFGGEKTLLIDRKLRKKHELPDRSEYWRLTFAPESDAFSCGASGLATSALYRLSDDAPSRQELPITTNAVWLSGRRLALMNTFATPRIRLVYPDGGIQTVVEEGASIEPLVSADRSKLLMVTDVDATTQLGTAIEVSAVDGSRKVLATGVQEFPFVATALGVLVARPHPIGSESEFTFLSNRGWSATVGSSYIYPTGEFFYGYFPIEKSPDDRYLAMHRFVPGKGWEVVSVDGQGSASTAVTPIAHGWHQMWWMGERRLMRSAQFSPPQSYAAGVYVTELP